MNCVGSRKRSSVPCMDVEIIESLSIADDDDDEEFQRPLAKNPFNNNNNNVNNGNNHNIATPTVVSPAASSVHELLECPVCTNSMYPPIHQIQPGYGLDCPDPGHGCRRIRLYLDRPGRILGVSGPDTHNMCIQCCFLLYRYLREE
ncbi:hypothetical protein KI387_003727, partial [Taxus chinensis]